MSNRDEVEYKLGKVEMELEYERLNHREEVQLLNLDIKNLQEENIRLNAVSKHIMETNRKIIETIRMNSSEELNNTLLDDREIIMEHFEDLVKKFKERYKSCKKLIKSNNNLTELKKKNENKINTLKRELERYRSGNNLNDSCHIRGYREIIESQERIANNAASVELMNKKLMDQLMKSEKRYGEIYDAIRRGGYATFYDINNAPEVYIKNVDEMGENEEEIRDEDHNCNLISRFVDLPTQNVNQINPALYSRIDELKEIERSIRSLEGTMKETFTNEIIKKLERELEKSKEESQDKDGIIESLKKEIKNNKMEILKQKSKIETQSTEFGEILRKTEDEYKDVLKNYGILQGKNDALNRYVERMKSEVEKANKIFETIEVFKMACEKNKQDDKIIRLKESYEKINLELLQCKKENEELKERLKQIAKKEEKQSLTYQENINKIPEEGYNDIKLYKSEEPDNVYSNTINNSSSLQHHQTPIMSSSSIPFLTVDEEGNIQIENIFRSIINLRKMLKKRAQRSRNERGSLAIGKESKDRTVKMEEYNEAMEMEDSSDNDNKLQKEIAFVINDLKKIIENILEAKRNFGSLNTLEKELEKMEMEKNSIDLELMMKRRKLEEYEMGTNYNQGGREIKMIDNDDSKTSIKEQKPSNKQEKTNIDPSCIFQLKDPQKGLVVKDGDLIHIYGNEDGEILLSKFSSIQCNEGIYLSGLPPGSSIYQSGAVAPITFHDDDFWKSTTTNTCLNINTLREESEEDSSIPSSN